jgi:Sec-independent protein translocase protein TatA
VLPIIFSRAGLVVIIVIVVIVLFPRRTPDAIKKLGKPMRAFPDEPTEASQPASAAAPTRAAADDAAGEEPGGAQKGSS